MTNYRVMEGEALVQWGNDSMQRAKDGRRYTPKGEGQPVCGRKFCNACGRWRHISDFHAAQRTSTGVAIVWQGECATCTRLRRRREKGFKGPKKWGRTDPAVLRQRSVERIRNDPDRLEARREYWRIFKEAQRREAGVPEREWRRGGRRDKGKGGRADAVDSGPFIAWLDDWQAHQASQRTFGMDPANYCPSAGLEDLAELAGCSVKAFWRARHEGRITISLVDRVLIAAGGSTMLIDLYPELYPDVEWVA